jgi:hypothetical protein
MRKIFVMAVFACFAAMNVCAQTEGTESKNEEMLRLTKAADENPTDWKAQFDAGMFLVNKGTEMYNPAQAEKYFERLFHLAMDLKKEVPDSVIPAAGMMLAGIAAGKEDLDRALFYIDAIRHAEKMGVRVGEDDGYSYLFDMWGAMYSMAKDEDERSLYYMTELRNHLTKDKKQGIEHTDYMTAMLYDKLMSKYMDMFGDKLIELTIDGKKYIALSWEEWNIEKPLMGWEKWMKERDQTEGDQKSLYYCCDDGKVTDDLHFEVKYSFYLNTDTKYDVKLDDATNVRLITVTPEQRQKMVDAYHSYMKKHKKDQKK